MRLGFDGLAQLTNDGMGCALAGFRMLENLAWEKFLYLGDLVTSERSRSKGHRGVLFDWLV